MKKIYSVNTTVLMALVGLLLYNLEKKPIITFDRIHFSNAFYGEGAAIGDINNDGNQDVVCGPFWYEGPGFSNRKAFYEPEKFGARFSQLHTLELSDIDGDGLQGIVTGKRFRASGPGRNIDHQSPAVLYWFKLTRDKKSNVNFIPYLVDDNSGVVSQFSEGDITGNEIAGPVARRLFED